LTIITIRSGLSFARSPDMFHFLSDEELQLLYTTWDKHVWDCDTLSGGTKSITCQHVLDVGKEKLVKAFGKKLAVRLLEIAERENV